MVTSTGTQLKAELDKLAQILLKLEGVNGCEIYEMVDGLSVIYLDGEDNHKVVHTGEALAHAFDQCLSGHYETEGEWAEVSVRWSGGRDEQRVARLVVELPCSVACVADAVRLFGNAISLLPHDIVSK